MHRAAHGSSLVLALVFVAASLGACQLLSGLDELDEGTELGAGAASEGGHAGAAGEGGIPANGGGGAAASGGSGVGGVGGVNGSGGEAGQGGAPCGPTVFVDADASGADNGGSWQDAFTELSAALALTASCELVSEIWVAAGRYTPGPAVTDTFALVDGVALLGGFAGDETSAGERNPALNLTVLSGDIGNDDDNVAFGVTPDWSDINGTNSRHVVTADGVDPSAVLDGFTITAGDANNDGGGIYVNVGSPTLNDLVIKGNRAVGRGGGFYAAGDLAPASPVMTNLTVTNNKAMDGGGLYARIGAIAPEELTLTNNLATVSGGGAWFESMTVTIMSGLIADNESDGSAGGVKVTAMNNEVVNIWNTAFLGNDAVTTGGALAVTMGGRVQLINVAVSGNRAGTQGGGIWSGGPDTKLKNGSVTGNRASTSGGGGGLYNAAGGVVIENTIVWHNADLDGADTLVANIKNVAMPGVANSVVQGSGGSGSWSSSAGTDNGDNLDQDPLFVTPVDPSGAATTAGDLHLMVGSPCIDSGDNAFNSVSVDIEGNTRIVNAIIDMGAYERQ